MRAPALIRSHKITSGFSMSGLCLLWPKWQRSCHQMFGRVAGAIDPLKSYREERCMKKYIKPSLKGLGLLRVVTKFSGCPAGEIPSTRGCLTIT